MASDGDGAVTAAAVSSCALGLDIGTTSVKSTIITRHGDNAPPLQIASASKDHHAYTNGRGCKTESRAEQDVAAILRAIDGCLRRLHADNPVLLASVTDMGIACQMHGVVRWRSVPPQIDLWSDSAAAARFCSTLITWEDRRCDAAFLAELNDASAPPVFDPSLPVLSGSQLSSGFGLASLAWIQRHSPQDESAFDHAGTIGDLVAYLLTASRVHAMDQTNAASWGWLDAAAASSATAVGWHRSRLEAAQIPLQLLPKLVPSASPLGALDPLLAKRWGLSSHTIVHTAVGDHPASIYAQSLGEGQMSLSMGTSSQVCRVARGLFQPAAALTKAASTHNAAAASTPPSPAVEHRPFIFPLSHSSLLLCASLNGGNVLQTFVQGLERAVRELASDNDAEEKSAAAEDEALVARRVHRIFAKLIRQGNAILQQQQQQSHTSSSAASSVAAPAAASSPVPLPLCNARFFSERCWPASRGSFTDLSFPLFDPRQQSGGAAAIFLALCRGVVRNLKDLIEGRADTEDARTAPSAACADENPQQQHARDLPAMLRDLQSIRCVGAALQRNPLLAHFVAEVFELSPERVVVSFANSQQQHGDADAAQGAALLAMDWERVIAPKWASQLQ